MYNWVMKIIFISSSVYIIHLMTQHKQISQTYRGELEKLKMGAAARSAAEDGTSQWISGPESRADTHTRRSNSDAILVGTATAIADDPELTARRPDGSYYEDQPIRVVIGQSPLPKTLRVFNDKAPTIEIKSRDLEIVLSTLWEQGIKHVFVEAGSKLASAFLAANLVNEFLIYLAPMLLGGKNTALDEIGITNISEAMRIEILETTKFGGDILVRARRA